mgnify:CR=1 FL=1
MGLFNVNLEEAPTVKGLIRTALNNLEMYEPYCSTGPREGEFKDSIGQTPPDYLVKDFAMKYLRDALEILEREGE